MHIPNFNPSISLDHFFETYWQKKPVLLTKAITPFPDYISADEMAGLAMEDEVESRLIQGPGPESMAEEWLLQHGPFEEHQLTTLPSSHWTLLIQTLEYWWPGVDSLKRCFDFIPRWRLDDIMLSFATEGGGVGPHLDQYDVFLIQGAGKRRWRVGQKDQPTVPRHQACGLKQIAPFEPEMDIIMEPGDVLYLPPNTPHWGVSIGDSYCYSVGFRAPSVCATFNAISYWQESQPNSHEQLFQDPYRNAVAHRNQLEQELVDWTCNQLQQLAQDKQAIRQILAQFISQSKLDPFESPINLKDETASAPNRQVLTRTAETGSEPPPMGHFENRKINPAFQLVWYAETTGVILWIEGESFEFPASATALVHEIADYSPISAKTCSFFKHSLAIRTTLSRMESKGYLQ